MNIAYLFLLQFQAMEKMLSSWEEVNFTFVQYKDTDVSVMGAPDEIQMMLDDHIVKTTTMKNSPFIAPFEEQVNKWDERLVRDFYCFILLI